MHRELPQGVKAIERFAFLSPDAPALIDPNGPTLTYDELWAQITAIGRHLNESGVSAEETVAVLIPQGPLQVIAVSGVLGYCACSPLQPRTVLEEVEASLRRLSASALIVSPEFEKEAEAALRMGLRVMFARPDQSPKEWSVKQPANQVRPLRFDSDAVLFLMTSATTGTPRIVPLSTANIDAGVSARCNSLKLSASDRQLLMTSLCHVLGVENTLAQFLAGGSVIVTGGLDPQSFRVWLEDLQPTWYDCAPALHKAALSELKNAPPRLPVSLRFVQSAGAALPSETKKAIEDVLQIPVFNDYGMTEACPIAVDAYQTPTPVEGSAGRTCGLEIGILSAAGELFSPGEEGEIAVRGPAVFAAYLDDPEANRKAFASSWFRTGDLGRLDAEGNLFITGRLKEMINRGGEKISPAEVDAVFCLHPAVRDAAAFAVQHPSLGEDVSCAVVLRNPENQGVSPIELRRFAAKRLARFKVPHRIYFVETIPRGELGKPQRWLLTQEFGQKSSTPTDNADVWDPHLPYITNDLHYKIREIWGRILNSDDVGLNEDFFEAGGDSLAAINMLAEVDQRCGSRTSEFAASFLDEPTIEHLAELVGTPVFPRPSYGARNEMRVFPVRSEGTRLRIYCIPADEDEGLYFHRLAKHLQGIIDLSIVRPANTFYSRSLFTFETAAAETTKLILREQHQGPYLVGGYCFGGIVAYEAAKQLAGHDRKVGLVLFDTPMPGYPTFWGYILNRLRGAVRKNRGRHLQANENPGIIPGRIASFAEPPARFAGTLLQTAGAQVRRPAWYAISHTRRFFLPIEHYAPVRWILERSEEDYFPFFCARPIDFPILHFLCTDESDTTQALSRLGWRRVARHGIEESFVPVSHMNLFHETKLSEMVNTLLHWIETKATSSGVSGELGRK